MDPSRTLRTSSLRGYGFRATKPPGERVSRPTSIEQGLAPKNVIPHNSRADSGFLILVSILRKHLQKEQRANPRYAIESVPLSGAVAPIGEKPGPGKSLFASAGECARRRGADCGPAVSSEPATMEQQSSPTGQTVCNRSGGRQRRGQRRRTRERTCIRTRRRGGTGRAGRQRRRRRRRRPRRRRRRCRLLFNPECLPESG